jgi:aspartyl protease family protein
MIAQTAKIVAALVVVALLSVAALRDHWFERGGGVLHALLAPRHETIVVQPATGVLAAPAARPGSRSGFGVVELSPDRNAQYATDIEIDGARIHALVDTGASHVMLTAEDARAANIDPPASAYTAAVQTANGTVLLAPTRLRELRVGQISVSNVEALVARPGQPGINLLGMSFLRKLSSFQVADGHFLMKQ